MPHFESGADLIYYELHGAATGRPPVILHHGLAQWGEDWKTGGWLAAFGGHQVLIFDALGHGRSTRPEEADAYSIARRAHTVLAIADVLGFSSFILFGFSLGGRVAFQVAATAPERLAGLIVGGMYGLSPNVDRKNLERRLTVLRSGKWRAVERALGVKSDDGRHNSQDSLSLSTEAVLSWEGAEAALPSLSTPVLIFCGANDSLAPFASQTALSIPVCQFTEILGTAHSDAFYSAPEAKAAVMTFLRGNWP